MLTKRTFLLPVGVISDLLAQATLKAFFHEIVGPPNIRNQELPLLCLRVLSEGIKTKSFILGKKPQTLTRNLLY